jgi:aspartate aminotransferase
VEDMRKQFEKRGKHMADKLNAIKGISCPQPTGAFYCFPDVSEHFGRTIGDTKIEGSMDFAKALLEQANVALVPGKPFGCDNNIRLSFATSLEQIDKGLDRLAEWLS